MGRASRRRRGQGPKERPHWWRTTRRRSYTLHPAEELAETRAAAAAVPVRTGAGAAAPVEDRGLMDIEVARRRSHEPTAVRAGALTRMAGIYSTLDRYSTPGRITRLPCWSKESGAGRGAVGSGKRRRITVDRADSEPEPR